MKKRFTSAGITGTALLALLLLSSPAMAWDLRKSADSASTSVVQDGIRLTFWCSRGGDRVSLSLSDISEGVDLSAPLKDISTSGAMMLWIELPDGRTSRDPFSGFNEQGSIAAEIPAGHINWDFFANGEALRIQDTRTRKTLFKSGMKGTGAARLAFRERCGI